MAGPGVARLSEEGGSDTEPSRRETLPGRVAGTVIEIQGETRKPARQPERDIASCVEGHVRRAAFIAATISCRRCR